MFFFETARLIVKFSAFTNIPVLCTYDMLWWQGQRPAIFVISIKQPGIQGATHRNICF